jgi:hypothetical protein
MVKQSDIELPIVFKNQLLFKSGNWNHISFSKEMVSKSISNTKWSALNKRLYLKHDGAFDVSKWKGKVENIKETTNGQTSEVRGDVELWDAEEGIQIMYGHKPVAISADIEYNDAGVMFFTGFAIENDPGVRDNQMFLSDAVKNELSGMYHAKFSNELDTTQVSENKTETQTNPIETQSAERRLLEDKQQTNMTETTNVTTQAPQNADLAKQLVERIDSLETAMKQELAKATQPVEVPKEEVKTEVKAEGTVAAQPLSTVVPQGAIDENMVNTLTDKIVEKLKPSFPQPVTINEFSGDLVDPQTETVNKLVESLAKI